jgi:hypothetical protein
VLQLSTSLPDAMKVQLKTSLFPDHDALQLYVVGIPTAPSPEPHVHFQSTSPESKRERLLKKIEEKNADE